ncbi:MAG TPA: hypothetical protein VFZ78_00445 [Flavisolibacter sp.]
MKQFLLGGLLTLSACIAFAQSEKYTKAMTEKIVAVDTLRNPDALKELSGAFERIGEAEKTQWLPFYYAALTQVNAGFMQTGGKMGGMAATLDPLADKAEQLIAKAEGLSADNSEIWLVKKMIASLRLMADPMNRYMQYGPQAQEALEMARKLNPENPRVYLLEGQDKFYTPEQFGGSKVEARKLFEQALAKYETFRPAGALEPNWGRGTTTYFLNQAKL